MAKVAWRKKLFFGLVGFGIQLFAFLAMSHNVFADTTYYDSSFVRIAYKICNSQGLIVQPYGCSSTNTADLSAPTLIDSDTNVSQYAFNIDDSYCSSVYECKLWIQYIDITVRTEVDNEVVYPDPNFINIKFWSGSDFYMGNIGNIKGVNYTDYWNIGDGMDAWLGTANTHYSCKDQSQSGDCAFGFWQNTVDYDSNNLYSGVQISASTDSALGNMFRFQNYPLDRSVGAISPSYYDYDTVLIFSGVSDPFVIYLQTWGSETLETVEDNATDVANSYYENEFESVDNISGQSPSDLDIGNSQPAMNLITYISTFITYLGSVSVANDCELALPLPSIMGGTTSANLCQGKDTMGNTISIVSSIALFVFFLPLAICLLRLIYGEIRSFTNG